MVSKEKEEHSLVKNKHRNLNGSQKKIVLGGPKEEEARRVHRRVKIASQNQLQAVITADTKAEARIGKETFALSDRKSAYPAHIRELDEDEDDKPFVRSDGYADSEDEDDIPLVQPTSRKEPVEEKRESAASRRVPTQVRRRKRTSSLAKAHLPHWSKMYQETRVSGQKKSPF